MAKEPVPSTEGAVEKALESGCVLMAREQLERIADASWAISATS